MISKVRHIVEAIGLRAMLSCLRSCNVCASLLLPALMMWMPLYVVAQSADAQSAATAHSTYPAQSLAADGGVVNGASEAKDSVRIYFKQGRSFFDPDLHDNRVVMAEYIDRIKVLSAEGRLNDIVVKGYTSPEGTDRINRRLAVARSRVLAEMIVRQGGIDPTLIKTLPGGINWEELSRLIEQRADVPAREALLDIIRNTPVYLFDSQGRIIGGRNKSLMDLQGGRPYRWLYDNLFPDMRNAVSISLYYTELTAQTLVEPADAMLKIDEVIDSICTPEPDAEIVVVEPVEDATETTTAIIPEIEPLHAFALKTNMLYYAALLPNLELEWYINDKWSVTLEGNLAWWGKYSKDRSYRLVMVSPEVRRWFRRGPMRRGFFVGATGGYGHYDLLKDRPGYRGWCYMAGLTFGYQWPISRHLSLEALIGAGYMHTNAKEYEPLDGHHVYMRTRSINYWGPIKLELSIAWRFYDLNKNKRLTPGR